MNITQLIRSEAVLFQSTVMAVVNMLIVFGVIHWTNTQIAAFNGVLVALSGMVVRAVMNGSITGLTYTAPKS